MAGQTTTVTTAWAPGQLFKRIKISFVADDTTNEFTAATVEPIYGYINRVVVVPSPGEAAGPKDGAWDLAITDENGVTVLAGSSAFVNMSATASVSYQPDVPPFVFTSLTVTPSGNTDVASAEVDVYIYIAK